MLFITVSWQAHEDCKGMIVTLINKKKRIDEKRRDLLKALMVTLLSYELINKKKPKTVTRPDSWLNVTFFYLFLQEQMCNFELDSSRGGGLTVHQ